MESKNSGKKERASKAMKEGQLPARITFSETCRVNVGDYEHRDMFLSYSDNVQEGETPTECVVRLKTFVRKKIYAAEKRHRMASREFVDFDTKAKIPSMKES